jgi:hypothetical protein
MRSVLQNKEYSQAKELSTDLAKPVVSEYVEKCESSWSGGQCRTSKTAVARRWLQRYRLVWLAIIAATSSVMDRSQDEVVAADGRRWARSKR